MSYEVNGVQYDYNSAKNQSIIDKLIDREVYCCMTSEMEYMLGRVSEADEDNPFDESDYINMSARSAAANTARSTRRRSAALLKTGSTAALIAVRFFPNMITTVLIPSPPRFLSGGRFQLGSAKNSRSRAVW